MTDHYRNRILLDGEEIKYSESVITNQEWSEMLDKFEARRSGTITLQESLVVVGGADEFLSGIENPKGYIKIGEMVLCPWVTKAEIISQ